jgi:hypothetical protein
LRVPEEAASSRAARALINDDRIADELLNSTRHRGSDGIEARGLAWDFVGAVG